jgi:serine/threonine protein kinase
VENPKNLTEEMGIDKEVANLISFIMKLDPAKRPSAREILQHEFFSKVSSEPFDVRDIF